MKVYEGKLIGKGLKFGLVVSRFNDFLSKRLLEGALDGLRRHDVAEGDIEVAWTPGAFEIPLLAKKLTAAGRYDGVIALGVILRGDTPHFDYICSEVTKGIAKVELDSGVPVAFGIITADTIEQAIERAGAKSGNKGFQAALSAIEMANLLNTVKS